MSDLTPEEKQFLANARDAWEPSSTSKTAVRAAIVERLIAEPGFGADAPGPDAVASAQASGLDRVRDALRGPWGIGTGLVVVGLCAVGLYVRSGELATPRAPEPQVQAPAPSEPLPSPSPSPETISTARTVDSVSVDALPNAAPAAPVARVAAQTSASDAPASDTLAEELALLRSAQASLRARSPDDALATLAKHASRFPHGALREERMTLQVLALCDRGDVSRARALRDELVRVAPGSSHVQRLSTSCAAP